MRRMYSVPDSLQDEVDRQIEKRLEQWTIEESENTYAASILCIRKRNGKIILTCDCKSDVGRRYDNINCSIILFFIS